MCLTELGIVFEQTHVMAGEQQLAGYSYTTTCFLTLLNLKTYILQLRL